MILKVTDNRYGWLS